MTMLLSGIARTSSKDNVRSWIAKFQDHFHFVWLVRLRHQSKTFSFQYTTFSFLKCDEKIVNIIFYKRCLSPLIWFFLLDKLLQALFVNVLQTSSLLADISGSRSRTKETMIFFCAIQYGGCITPVISPRAACKRSIISVMRWQ